MEIAFFFNVPETFRSVSCNTEFSFQGLVELRALQSNYLMPLKALHLTMFGMYDLLDSAVTHRYFYPHA